VGGVDEAGVLRRPTLAALTWYVSVCGGLVLVVLALLRLPPEAVADMGWPLFVIAAMMLIGELRPVLTGDTAAPEPVPFSTAFVLASLVLWGAPVAIVLQAVSVLVSELVAGKPPWKPGLQRRQYVLAMGAAPPSWPWAAWLPPRRPPRPPSTWQTCRGSPPRCWPTT
jgi:hypothetical protein